MLRRLCQRNIFQNKNGVVSSIITKQEFQGLQSEQFVKETFGGSLPHFLAAFALRKKLSENEIDQLQKLINQHKGWRNGRNIFTGFEYGDLPQAEKSWIWVEYKLGVDLDESWVLVE